MMPMDAQSTFTDFVQSLLGRRVSYASLFLNSLRVCIDRELGEKAGFFLWLEPIWHLGSGKGVLVGSRQAQTEEHEAHAALNLLVEQILGKHVESVSIEVLTNDIDVRFSDGYWVRTFVSDATDDESWYLWDCQSDWVVTGSPKGLRLEKHDPAQISGESTSE
jgi:hypothetical protein